jgi:hypothetical protein
VEVDAGLVQLLLLMLQELLGLEPRGRQHVQVAEEAAQLGLLLHQVGLVSLARQRGRRHHPGDPAADDQRRLGHGALGDLERHEAPGLLDPHPDHVHGLQGGRLLLRLVHPRVLVADVRHL